MANNYDEYEYDDSSYSNRRRNDSSDFLVKFGVAMLMISAIIIIIMLITSCTNKRKSNNNGGDDDGVKIDYVSSLLAAGKKYYINNKNEYPASPGECSQVTLQTLIMGGLLSSEDFKQCNSVNTYVRVCMLENQTLQYTPWFACNDKLSSEEYGEKVEGSLSSIVPDSTYVEFIFLPQTLQNTQEQLGNVEEVWKDDIKYTSYKTLEQITYYRYRDELFRWNVTSKLYYTTTGDKSDASSVKEYFVSPPSGRYTYSDSKTTEAYKWYTTTSKKEYARTSSGDKALSTKPIGDYNMNEGGIIYTMHKTRTVTGSRAPTLYYACATSTTSPYRIFQPEACPSKENPSYKYQMDKFYSCADPTSASDSVLGQRVNENDKCVKYSDWSVATYGACPSGKSDTCIEVSATFYYWYKMVDNGDRTYYPSGASTANGERVYYTSAPTDGAIKDQATRATAYKWYKQDTTTTSNYTAVAPRGYINASKTGDSKWSDWSNWSKSNPKTSDGRNRQIESKVKIKLQEIKSVASTDWVDLSVDYMSEDQMIRVLQNKGYNIGTLKDINNNGEIRYQMKMLVRNKIGGNY